MTTEPPSDHTSTDSPMPGLRGLLQRAWLGWGVAVLLLVVFFVQGLAFVRTKSQTLDEAVHLAAGYSYLDRGDFRLNREHPPLMKELAALPLYAAHGDLFAPDPRAWDRAEQWPIGRDFLYRSKLSWRSILVWGRVPILLCGLMLVALIGWWAYRLWGPAAGLVALALASFEPNLIAHSGLVTTDVGMALFVFLAMYSLWEYTRKQTPWRLAAVGAATGMALASKYSAVLLPGILAVACASYAWSVGSLSLEQLERRLPARLQSRAAGAVMVYLLVLLTAILIVLAAYRFQGLSSWWDGLGDVMSHRKRGHTAFFLGEFSSEGWWSYFVVAFVIKTPVGSLLLIAASLVLFRRGKPFGREHVIFLWVPVACLFATTLIGGINIGLRHILPVYPFLFVAAARVATVRFERPLLRPVVVGGALLLTIVSSVRVSPHYLSYFNELVGGPARGHRYLSDSNIDWGQDLDGLRRYMAKRKLPIIYLSYFGSAPPEALGIRFQLVPPSLGRLSPPPRQLVPPDTRPKILAISVFSRQGMAWADDTVFDWLRRRTPVGTVGYSIYLYDVTDDADAHFHMAMLYLRDGMLWRATSTLRTGLKIDSTRKQAVRLMAELAQTTKRASAVDEAIVQLRAALGSRPFSAAVFNDVGVAFARRGRLELAIPCFRRAVQMNPRDPNARRNLRRALSRP